MATAVAEIDKAPRPGGLYYRPDGTGVDAEGNVVEGAPPREADTPPEKQPGYVSPIGGFAPTVNTAAQGIMVTPEMLQQLVAAEVAKLTEPAQHPTG